LAEVKAQSAPTGSITINSGDLATASPSVALTLAVDDPDKYVLFGYNNYNAESTATWDSFFSSTRPWELLPGEGPKTVYYFLKDNLFVSGILCGSDSIILDTSLPTGSIEINDDDAYTTSSTVTLTLIATDTVSGVSQIRLSNDGTWNSEIEEWGSFSSPKPWTLASGDGTKTVYYQVKDNAGQDSIVYTDSIVLDNVVPTGSVMINNGDAFTTSPSVALTLTANDPGSGVYRVRYSNDGTWDSEAWENFSPTKPWTLSAVGGDKTVYYQIRDNAGLESMFSDTIVLDTAPPTGSVKINSDNEYTTSGSVILHLTANDATSGVYRVRYSNDGDWDTESWTSFSSSKSWSLSSGDGTKTVYYQVSDNAGLTSTFSDSIVLDTAVPAGSVVINDGAAFTSSASVTLTLTAIDQTSGVYRVRISNDGTWDTESWTAFSETEDWTLSPGNGVKTVYFQIEDRAGYTSSTYSDSITLSTRAPTGSIIINGDNETTTSNSVTLSLTYQDEYSNVDKVRYSNDGIWDNEAWETPTATKSWSLTSGDEVKTVYYQMRNTMGLVSSTYSDTIVLDTVPPRGSILINNGDESTNQYSVTLKLTANDLTSGVFQVRYSNDGAWDTESWENFSSTKEWTLSSGEGSKTVHYQIKDRAELVSVFSDSIILESPSPTPTPTATPTPTPSSSQSLPPSGSPTSPSEQGDGTPGVIPPGVFYATAIVGLASIATIVFVTFRKPKSTENTDDTANVSSQLRNCG
jgi:hypothetical protein